MSLKIQTTKNADNKSQNLLNTTTANPRIVIKKGLCQGKGNFLFPRNSQRSTEVHLRKMWGGIVLAKEERPNKKRLNRQSFTPPPPQFTRIKGQISVLKVAARARSARKEEGRRCLTCRCYLELRRIRAN